MLNAGCSCFLYVWSSFDSLCPDRLFVVPLHCYSFSRSALDLIFSVKHQAYCRLVVYKCGCSLSALHAIKLYSHCATLGHFRCYSSSFSSCLSVCAKLRRRRTRLKAKLMVGKIEMRAARWTRSPEIQHNGGLLKCLAFILYCIFFSPLTQQTTRYSLYVFTDTLYVLPIKSW